MPEKLLVEPSQLALFGSRQGIEQVPELFLSPRVLEPVDQAPKPTVWDAKRRKPPRSTSTVWRASRVVKARTPPDAAGAPAAARPSHR